MSKPNFTWNPDLGAKLQVTPTVKQTKFGEGYEARVSFGVNTLPRIWNMSFTNSNSTTQAILSFLETQAGVQSFTWTDPQNVSNVYVCRDWGMAQSMFGVYTITAKFEQVFEA